jgi:glucokinase
MEPKNLVIEIGGTKLQFVLGDPTGSILQRWRLPVDKAKSGAGIRHQIEATLPGILASADVSGIGVGFGGPVDWKTGRICRSHQIEGWSDFELGQWLQSLSQLTVRVDNDANTAALGETLHGAGRDFNPVFYVTLGSGVGGGLTSDGEIYHGAKPGESEIGHVRLDRFGTTVESRCSGWAVDARIREFIAANPQSLLARLAGEVHGGEARFLAAALEQGDEPARRILREAAEDLAFALSHVVHLFHPEVIVIGGGLSLIGEPLQAAVASAMQRFVMDAFSPGPIIVLAALGEDAVPVGALALARHA